MQVNRGMLTYYGKVVGDEERVKKLDCAIKIYYFFVAGH